MSCFTCRSGNVTHILSPRDESQCFVISLLMHRRRTPARLLKHERMFYRCQEQVSLSLKSEEQSTNGVWELQVDSLHSSLGAQLNSESMLGEHFHDARASLQYGAEEDMCTTRGQVSAPEDVVSVCHHQLHEQPKCAKARKGSVKFENKFELINHRTRLHTVIHKKLQEKFCVVAKHHQRFHSFTTIRFQLHHCDQSARQPYLFVTINYLKENLENFCNQSQHFLWSTGRGLTLQQQQVDPELNAIEPWVTTSVKGLRSWYNPSLCEQDGGILTVEPIGNYNNRSVGALTFAWTTLERPVRWRREDIVYFKELNLTVNIQGHKQYLYFPTTQLPQCFEFVHRRNRSTGRLQEYLLTDNTFCQMTGTFRNIGSQPHHTQLKICHLKNENHDANSTVMKKQMKAKLHNVVPLCEKFLECVSRVISWRQGETKCIENGMQLPSVHSKDDMDVLNLILAQKYGKVYSSPRPSRVGGKKFPGVLYQPMGVYIALKVGSRNYTPFTVKIKINIVSCL